MGMVLDKASMQFSLDETDYRGDDLIAPNGWRLLFARRWREKPASGIGAVAA